MVLYKPATDVLPSYFYSMLDDLDRATRYWRAITACIRWLRDNMGKERREIVVVDVGSGTGLLSAFALAAGADFVVGVDVNPMANAAAARAVRAVDRTEGSSMASRFVSVLVKPGDRSKAIRSKVTTALTEFGLSEVARRELLFDAVISEVLGTLVFGESMKAYITPYLQMTRPYVNRVVCVPQKCTQLFGVYEFPEFPLPLRGAVESALHGLPQKYVATDSRGLGIPLHLHLWRRVLDPEPFYEANYGGEGLVSVTYTKRAFETDQDDDGEHMRLGVCEWVCVLWDGIALSNTLQGYADIASRLGHRHALARQEAWGVAICLANHVDRITAKYTGAHGMHLTLGRGREASTLGEFAYDECPEVCLAGDKALVTDIAREVQNLAATPLEVVIVNDITCGGLCAELSKIPNVRRLRVVHSRDRIKAHEVTRRVVMAQNLRVECEPVQARRSVKSLRDMLHAIVTEDGNSCLVLPELCYMDSNHASRVALFKNALGESACKTIPSIHTVSTVSRSYQCAAEIGPLSSCREIRPVMAHVGALRQLQTHTRLIFSTRDFTALPFLPSSTTSSALRITIEEVFAGGSPCASLRDLRILAQRGDVQSLYARSLGGSGLSMSVCA